MQKSRQAKDGRGSQKNSGRKDGRARNGGGLQSVWEVFQPFFLYYVCYVVAYLGMRFLCLAVAGLSEGFQTYVTGHEETVTGIVNGLAMLAGVLPLLPMLRRELRERSRGNAPRLRRGGLWLLTTVVLAVSSSLGMNVLLTLSGMLEVSAAYRDVAQQQYGVAFGVGVLLYGLTSPVTEEIVFRGLVFNRLRRFCPPVAAVLLSGALFGVYHGNLVQGLYGGCMGILMSYLYERQDSFLIPCLFHAVANLAVYTVSQSGELVGRIFTVYYGAGLLAVSALCILLVEKGGLTGGGTA